MDPYLKTYVENPLVRENPFLSMEREEADLPAFERSRARLPEPRWPGHAVAIDCYWKAWELAFQNLRRPAPGSGFVANFIDTAFNDCLFMWDSAFILMFGRYGRRAFDFQRTLDNFYAHQHPDGFICRQLRESDGQDCFHRFDPASTGPNVLPWCEWDYFLSTGDRGRFARVHRPLVAYHQWLRTYRTWKDGSYWSSGWGCGMDNQPRLGPADHPHFSHGHMSWIDACLQQVLSARQLLAMAEILGTADEMDDFRSELDQLVAFVNQKMWDESTAFYHDRLRDGRLSPVKTIGAYWALLADVVPEEPLDAFLQHLENPAEFQRPHPVPSLSADDPAYRGDGGYWRGGVWAPTNYMVLRGLTQVGRDDLAHDIALAHLDHVVQVFEQTGTLWENYAPDAAARGNWSKADMVGWTGLPPIAVLFEYVFGLRPDVPSSRLVWDVRLTGEHGVARYPFAADGLLDLACAARTSASERPRIHAAASVDLDLEVRWGAGRELVHLATGTQTTF